MEPYNNRRDDQGGFNLGGTSALIPGLVLVGIGALFLLGNLHIVHVSSWVAYWPVILIAIGLVKLVDSTDSGGRITGGVLMGIGGLFLADNLGYITFNLGDLWPLILIGIGLMMLWSRTHPGEATWWDRPHRYAYKARMRSRFGTGMPMSGGVYEFAIFGGSRRVVTDQDFKGGRIACVFGGVYMDLTGAAMVGNTAVLDISTVYGGATVRIPPSWNLEVRGAGIFGGFADHTIHPPASPDMKRLIVKGAAVFGGVTFKN
jgi:predicted membrane protein